MSSKGKGKSRVKTRRKVRHNEKGSKHSQDKLLGNCARRNYGQGLAS